MMPSGNDSQQLTQLIRALMGNARSSAFSGGPYSQTAAPTAAPKAPGGGGLMGGLKEGLDSKPGDGLKKMMGMFLPSGEPTSGLEGLAQFTTPPIGGPPTGPPGMGNGFFNVPPGPGGAGSTAPMGGGAPSIRSTLKTNMAPDGIKGKIGADGMWSKFGQ